MNAARRGGSPLILTERIDHLDILAGRLRGLVKNLIVLRGGMGAKQRMAVMDYLARAPPVEESVLLATGRSAKDLTTLDSILCSGRCRSHGRARFSNDVGRLHRLHANKKEVIVYDYADDAVPMLAAMFGRRLRGYEAAGYSMEGEELPFSSCPAGRLTPTSRLFKGKVKVTATFTPVPGSSVQDAKTRANALDSLRRIAAREL